MEIGMGKCMVVSYMVLSGYGVGDFDWLYFAVVLIGGSFREQGSFYVSSVCVFWRILGECVSLVLVFPVVWVWIVLNMLWLFYVSLWRMVTVSFDLVVPAFIFCLLMLYSRRLKCGSRVVYGIWIREVFFVGHL